jgi:hypothetical protein
MKLYKAVILIAIIMLRISLVLSQKDSIKWNMDPGKVSIKIFTNFYTGLTRADPSSAFEARRAYFGYMKNLDERFSGEIKLDIGSPNDISEYSRIHRYAYFKIAALYYRTSKIFFKFGIIDIDHFDLQENHWKHRYIYKSFQDEFRFGDKADLGASFHYIFSEIVRADITIMNGEGYQNLQRDNTFKTGMGLTLYPAEGYVLRIYADYSSKDETQYTLSTFAGYNFAPLMAGVEYNHKYNKDYLKNRNQWGFSGYCSYDLNNRLELFGRYDLLRSNILSEDSRPWNLSEDGSVLIAGIQFAPVRGVRIALNYQDWYPYAANLANLSYIYLNLELFF